MPWTCDALLDEPRRYASRKFRLFAERFDPTRLDYADALELVAFLGVVQVEHARWIFRWKKFGIAQAERLRAHLADDAREYIDQNWAAVTPADGLACLRAMQDGGWKRGTVPPIVRMALQNMRDEGMSRTAIADACRLSLDQVRWICNGPRRPRVGIGALFAK